MLMIFWLCSFCTWSVKNEYDLTDPFKLVCLKPEGLDCSDLVDNIRWYLVVNVENSICSIMSLNNIKSLTLRLQNKIDLYLLTFTLKYGVGHKHVVDVGCAVKVKIINLNLEDWTKLHVTVKWTPIEKANPSTSIDIEMGENEKRAV